MDTTNNDKMDEFADIFTENLKEISTNEHRKGLLMMLSLALIGEIFRILKENKLVGLEESADRIKKMWEELAEKK